MSTQSDISLNDVIRAYACGLFPMADSADSREFYWYEPPLRGQLPIKDLHIPRRLKKTVLQFPYEVTIDQDFPAVIDLCAESADDRPSTWINQGIRDIFVALHEAGLAHSVECRQNGVLVGGLYGLALGGAFMGESMVSRATDASKIALVHLCARLWEAGFTILDTQYTNDHLKQFGIYEITRDQYLQKLEKALTIKQDFTLHNNNLTETDLVIKYLSSRNS